MAVHPARHRLGPEHGRIILRTFRDGLASQAGHDLTIEATRWSGDLTTGADLVPTDLEVRIDMGALIVRDGSGGIKPLTERDKREIAVTAGKVLSAGRHPEARFTASGFEPAGPGGVIDGGVIDGGVIDGGVISGTLSLAGSSRPLRLRVSKTGPDSYRATTTVVQTEFGIKPYSAFLGSLRVRDAVEVEAEVDLADAPAGEAETAGLEQP